jgi:hypothetical protein
MPDTTRFAVRVPGGFCTLFTVVEKANGELIIPIRGGDRLGADWATGKQVLEQRYSVHPSPRSKEFNVIKLTLNVESSRSITAATLTDAVKLKNGFSIIFARRSQRLTDRPSEEPKSQEKLFALPDFDPSHFNLFYAIFVGHPDVPFDATDPDIVVSAFPFKTFKLIVMASLYQLPSHHTTEFLHSITMPPETKINQQALSRFLMTGRSPEVCLQQYRNSVKLLVSRFLRMILETESDLSPKGIENIQRELEKISLVGLTPLGVAQDQSAIYMLTSGPLPNSRSPSSGDSQSGK